MELQDYNNHVWQGGDPSTVILRKKILGSVPYFSVPYFPYFSPSHLPPSVGNSVLEGFSRKRRSNSLRSCRLRDSHFYVVAVYVVESYLRNGSFRESTPPMKIAPTFASLGFALPEPRRVRANAL
jgi:hypothetical protein